MSGLFGGLTDEIERSVEQLAKERIELDSMVLRERMALDSIFSRERKAIMEDANTIATNITKTTFQKINDLVTDLFFYIIILLAIIIFLPFGLGFFAGRIFTKNKPKSKD
jgi:hypothetical protein